MKEEWKVYIKGVPNRGNEVIKILEDLGAKNSNEYKCCYADYLYYIGHDGNIHLEYEEREEAKIIMDNYREIKLPEKWKDGDILYNETNKEFAVVKYKCKFDSDVVVTYFVTCYGTYLTNKSIYTGNFRLATKSEITQLHEHLHAIGKDWDAEKKQLVDWKWKPKENDSYYYIDHYADIVPDTWDGCNVDAARYSFGNCFRTEEEAKVMAEKVKKLLKGEL